MTDGINLGITLIGSPLCQVCGQITDWGTATGTSKLCSQCNTNGVKLIATDIAKPIVTIQDIGGVLQEAKLALEFSIAAIMTSAASFINDPPDSQYQKGYLAAIQVTAEETMQPLADVLPKINELLSKLNIV